MIIPPSDAELTRRGVDFERLIPFAERVKLTRGIIKEAGDSSWLFVEPCMEGCLKDCPDSPIPLIWTYAKGRIGGPLAETRVLQVFVQDPVYSSGYFGFTQIIAGVAPTRPRPIPGAKKKDQIQTEDRGNQEHLRQPAPGEITAFVGGMRKNGGAEGVAGASPIKQLGSEVKEIVVHVRNFHGLVDYLWAVVKEPTLSVHQQVLTTICGQQASVEIRGIQARKHAILKATGKLKKQKNPFKGE